MPDLSFNWVCTEVRMQTISFEYFRTSRQG
jgi:hypothetical protein